MAKHRETNPKNNARKIASYVRPFPDSPQIITMRDISNRWQF